MQTTEDSALAFRKSLTTTVALLIAMVFAAATPLQTLAATSTSDAERAQLEKGRQLVYEGMQVAVNRGPILWYVEDDEKRAEMEDDVELLRLYNEAMKAKHRRMTISSALFYPGLSVFIIGLVGGIFQHAIGLYGTEEGTNVLIVGVAVGTGLMVPGIYFRAKTSKQEKAYRSYVKEKYEVIPILKYEKDGGTMYGLAVGGRF